MNRAILKVTENGQTYCFDLENNYEMLLANLNSKIDIELLESGMRGGLTEKYVTTMTTTEHVGPVAGKYATLLSLVSGVLGYYGIPGATAAAVASALAALGYSSVEAWITTKRDFYGVYDSTGSFLGYYNVSYAVYTDAMVNGRRQTIDTEVGTYASLGIY